MILSAVFYIPAQTPKPEENVPTKPSIAVIFERQTIRENDTVQVQIWLSNEWDQDLTEIVLHVTAPSFLRWRATSCPEWAQNSYQGKNSDSLSLGSVPARTIRSYNLCFKSDADILVGDYMLPFTFEYSWTTPKAVQHSFVTVEKPLKANLFGTDTVAGVPLALASFVIPGLFFWMIVTWFNISWMPLKKGDLALGESLIYSVLVSVVIIALGELLKFINITGFGFIRFIDITAGVSFAKLSYLALAGSILGILLGGVNCLALYIKRKKAESQQSALQQAQEAAEKARVQIDDNEQTLREKLSEGVSFRRPEATVTLKDGKTYIGSLAKKETAAALMGWLQISLEEIPEDVRAQLTKFVDEGNWHEAFLFAHQQKISITARETIFEMVGGQRQQTAGSYMRWGNDEVESCEVVEGGGNTEPPLTLV